MSIVKATSHSSKSAGRTIDYALNEKKTVDKETDIQYVEGFGGCSPQTAKEDFKVNKQYWEKTGGRQCMHYINSFPAGEVTPQEALDRTRELIEKTPEFKGYQGVMACHCDGEYNHVHIVVDSVSVENGKKFQMGPDAYQRMKEINHDVCMEHGLTITPFEKEPDNLRADNINKYKALERGDSAIDQCMTAVQSATGSATNREEFIAQMKEQGWSTNWKDSRTAVTFTSDQLFKANGKPYAFRNTNLTKTYQEDVGKERLEHAFEENRLRSRTIKRAIESADKPTDREDKRVDTKAIDQAIGNRQLGAIGVEAERREREIAKIKQERERAEREKQRLAEKAESERTRAKETIHRSQGMSR